MNFTTGHEVRHRLLRPTKPPPPPWSSPPASPHRGEPHAHLPTLWSPSDRLHRFHPPLPPLFILAVGLPVAPRRQDLARRVHRELPFMSVSSPLVGAPSFVGDPLGSKRRRSVAHVAIQVAPSQHHLSAQVPRGYPSAAACACVSAPMWHHHVMPIQCHMSAT